MGMISKFIDRFVAHRARKRWVRINAECVAENLQKEQEPKENKSSFNLCGLKFEVAGSLHAKSDGDGFKVLKHSSDERQGIHGNSINIEDKSSGYLDKLHVRQFRDEQKYMIVDNHEKERIESNKKLKEDQNEYLKKCSSSLNLDNYEIKQIQEIELWYSEDFLSIHNLNYKGTLLINSFSLENKDAHKRKSIIFNDCKIDELIFNGPVLDYQCIRSKISKVGRIEDGLRFIDTYNFSDAVKNVKYIDAVKIFEYGLDEKHNNKSSVGGAGSDGSIFNYIAQKISPPTESKMFDKNGRGLNKKRITDEIDFLFKKLDKLMAVYDSVHADIACIIGEGELLARIEKQRLKAVSFYKTFKQSGIVVSNGCSMSAEDFKDAVGKNFSFKIKELVDEIVTNRAYIVQLEKNNEHKFAS